MRLSHCTQCEVRLGPGNAELGSEMCYKCRMQQVGIIQQADYVHTRPQTTAPQRYRELVYELRPAAAPQGYRELVYELRPAAAPQGYRELVYELRPAPPPHSDARYFSTR